MRAAPPLSVNSSSDMDFEDDAPPELVNTATVGDDVEGTEEVTVKVPITIVTGKEDWSKTVVCLLTTL